MPEFIIYKETHKGYLSLEDVQKLRNILEDGGVVLLPSDTCYSLAILPKDINMRKIINTILNREDIPFSFAFPDLNCVKRYMKLNSQELKLFEKFTPGYITIVCHAIEKSFADISRSQDGTIGVRITNSIIERTIAGCTDYPITTVPPKFNNYIVQDFNLALKIVKEGINKLDKKIKWAAIEGFVFDSKASTVVGVNEDGSLREIFEREIPYYSIRSVLQD